MKKKLILPALLIILALPGNAQANKSDLLQGLENNKADNQKVTTATVKSASRLFGAKDDLTSVILIIPAGSVVSVLGSDSTYLQVTYEENDGFILKRQAAIDNVTSVTPAQTVRTKPPVQQAQPAQEEQVSRFSYLESKYGTSMAARLSAGKIWKGMSAGMVKDSWGTAEKINREIGGDIIKEEWIFKNTWLYFENNTLVDWGPIRK